MTAPGAGLTVTREWLARLPKAELHTHLDGCLRPATLLELARVAGVRPPGDTPEAISDALLVRHARNLDEYLERYVVTVSVMRSAGALARIARELVEDAAADGVRYLEARFCPALHGPEVGLEEAIEAVLDGLARGERATGTVSRLIACGLRVLPPGTSLAIARAAIRYAGRGLVAFDLAGAEAGHPAEAHADAFRVAREGGLRITCHAGEAAGPESIRSALDVCRAERLGHGVRLREEPALEALVAERGIPLEMCLTSNVHTRAVRRLDDHPARRYLQLGIPVTLNTDSRLMDRTTLTHEFWMAHTTLGFSREELVRVARNGFAHAFLPDDERRRLLDAVTPALEGAA